MIKSFLVSFAIPPGLFLSAWLLGWLLRKPLPKLARTLRYGSLACLFLASIPYLANSALYSLQGIPPLEKAPVGSRAIVVLGGNFRPWTPEYATGRVGPLTLERLRHGATWQRKTGLPVLVSTGIIRFDGLSGGRAMAECLEEDFDVPVRWVEERAGTTHDNAVLSAAMLREAGIDSIILVTHAWHMPRAKASFERQGLVVHPAPTAFHPPPKARFASFLPSPYAYRHFFWAAHEWIGLGYYRLLSL